MDNNTVGTPEQVPLVPDSSRTPLILLAGLIIMALVVWFAIRLPNVKVETNKMSGLERIYFGANIQSSNTSYPGVILLDSMSKLILYQTFVIHRPNGTIDTVTSVDSLALEKNPASSSGKPFDEGAVYNTKPRVDQIAKPDSSKKK